MALHNLEKKDSTRSRTRSLLYEETHADRAAAASASAAGAFGLEDVDLSPGVECIAGLVTDTLGVTYSEADKLGSDLQPVWSAGCKHTQSVMANLQPAELQFRVDVLDRFPLNAFVAGGDKNGLTSQTDQADSSRNATAAALVSSSSTCWWLHKAFALRCQQKKLLLFTRAQRIVPWAVRELRIGNYKVALGGAGAPTCDVHVIALGCAFRGNGVVRELHLGKA